MSTLLRGSELAARKDRLYRAYDVAGAACAILFVLPLIAVLSLLIACHGPGPVFVRDRRVRADGSHCDLLRFRSPRDTQMVANDGRDVDTPLSKLGAILRTTGLDDLPMLINVFTGELPICGRYTWRQVIAWLSTGEPQDRRNVR